MSRTLELGGDSVTIRAFGRHDTVEVARFAASLPEQDLLFLTRDIQHSRVIAAWLAAVEAGEIDGLVACVGDRCVATTAVVRDPLSWSPHVAEIRLLVAPEFRGKGLGRALLAQCIAIAVEAGATKLTARMTPDQLGAITLFEEAGFRGEALLRDQVRDRQGQLHDLAVLALDVAAAGARQSAYGLDSE